MGFKQIGYTLVFLVVLAAGFGLWTLRANAPAPVAQEEHVLAGSTTPQGDYLYTEDTPYYTIKAAYPAKTPLTAAADVKARLVIEQTLAFVVALFKRDNNLNNLTAEDVQIQGLGPDRKYAFNAEYKTYSSPNYLSYFYTLYEDTLGAHPNGFFLTFVFDKQGDRITLADLFKPDARYLDRLSAEAQKQVLVQLAERTGAPVSPDMADTVRVGTSPSPETLQFFYIDGDTLVLAFPPYQVASYAAGTFEARIPLASLQDILK